jgi:putative NADH-flavin reductase
MKIAIFGASGRTGVPLVRQALDAGYEVTAFVRDRSKLPVQHERLTVVEGDVSDQAAVERAVSGADAVISALGPSKTSPKNMMETAAKTIITAMRKHGVTRLVSVTGAGVPAPQDQPKLVNHIFSFALGLLAADVLRDSKAHVSTIEGSGLEWVVVRVPRLTDDPPTGKIRVGWAGVNTGTTIGRADVASFMLKQVTDASHLRQMPMISW